MTTTAIAPQEIKYLRDSDLDYLIHTRVLGGDPTGLAAFYTTNLNRLPAVLGAIHSAGWTLVIRTRRDIGTGSEAADTWYVSLSCSKGPCELHGSDICNWHGLAVKVAGTPSIRLMLRAICEAAVLSTCPARELIGIPHDITFLASFDAGEEEPHGSPD